MLFAWGWTMQLVLTFKRLEYGIYNFNTNMDNSKNSRATRYVNKDKEDRINQLSLIIHNARIYGVEVKQEWLNELNELSQ